MNFFRGKKGSLVVFDDTDSELGARNYCNTQKCGVKNSKEIKVLFGDAEYICNEE